MGSFFTSLGFTWRIGFTLTAGLNEPDCLEKGVCGVAKRPVPKVVGWFGVLAPGD